MVRWLNVVYDEMRRRWICFSHVYQLRIQTKQFALSRKQSPPRLHPCHVPVYFTFTARPVRNTGLRIYELQTESFR